MAIQNLIEACDLTTKTNISKTLSNGQKRKHQPACAFIRGSLVCLLDKVTSGLGIPLSSFSQAFLIEVGTSISGDYIGHSSSRASEENSYSHNTFP